MREEHKKLLSDILALINNSGINYNDDTPEATQIQLIINMADESILEALKEEWPKIVKYGAWESNDILPYIYGNMYYPENNW